MSKLKIELKQNTPLIQFQGEQYHATLRASEFKPKLDKFLIKKTFNDDFDRYNKYLIGYKEGKVKSDFNGKEAFNYKLKIIVNDNNQLEKKPILSRDRLPLYFANMGDDGEKNWRVTYSNITLEFFSYNKEILRKIAIDLPAFLMRNNFGQRQSKGYGSFYINDNLKYTLDNEEKRYMGRTLESIKPKIILKLNVEEPFKEIEKFHKKLRNEYIREYIKNKYKHSNLKFIDVKQEIKDIFKEDNKEVGEGIIVKDLLGLAVEEDWGDFKIIKENEEIKRMKSPILFKPIRNGGNKYTIYIEISDELVELSKESFIIRNSVNNKYINATVADYFDVNEFIMFAIKKYDNRGKGSRRR